MPLTISDDPIGAFVPHNLDAPVPGSGSGPLAGRRFVVKDLYDIAGRKTGNGSPDFYAATESAKKTAASVQKLLDAGADLVGITVCDEFFYSLTGANAHYGTPANARAPGRMPGGSSSGSAAAVAAELCDFSMGSDTGGSVRVPAAFCGLYGIRPTHGRVDLTGGRAMAPSIDTAGWFTNEAQLLRSIGGVLLDDAAIATKPHRLLLAEDSFRHADEAVSTALKKVLENASAVLQSAGEVTVAPEGYEDWRETFRIVQGSEVKQTNLPWVRAHNAQLGPGIKERFAMAEAITDEETAWAKDMREKIRERVHALVPAGTILCLPSAPVIAPFLDATPQDLEGFRVNTMALTCIAGLAGLPQVSLPAANVENCPVGLSFIAWSGGDEALLDLAVAMAPHCVR